MYSSNRVFSILSIVAAIWLLVPSTQPVFAQDGATSISKRSASTAGAHQHDGFFLRMTAGGGIYGVEGSGTGAGLTNPSSDRGGQGMSLAIGGIVAPNLALHADFHLHGSAFGDRGRDHYGSSMVNFGLTYYFMPYNIYISTSVGYAAALVFVENEDGSAPDRSNFEDTYGVGFTASVGKEWWVSDNWGLGFALQGIYSYTKDNNITFRQGGLMLLFSATYN